MCPEIADNHIPENKICEELSPKKSNNFTILLHSLHLLLVQLIIIFFGDIGAGNKKTISLLVGLTQIF